MMKTNLYVLYGGKSVEHEVSLQTAATVMNRLDKEKYDVYPVYITEQGIWHAFEQLGGEITDISRFTCANQFATAAGSIGEIATQFFAKQGDHVIFPVIHGTNGEDGTLQGLLEMLDLPYVGNGVAASAVSIDKILTKKLAAAAGIPQAAYIAFDHLAWRSEAGLICEEIEQTIGYPCYVKPAKLGSSVGINRCDSRLSLRLAIEGALRYDRKLLVEKEIGGREIQIAVLGNEYPVCSVAGEFVRETDFFSYSKKYENGALVKRIPAVISEETEGQLRDMAITLFKALDGSGLMRADFFVTGEGELYLNEVNAMPGFTANSMFPILWEKTDGTTYTQLLDKLIGLAVQRQEQKRDIRYRRVEA